MSEVPLSVLLIEDNAALQRGIAAVFESRGHRMDFASDGIRGLEMALRNPPDVLVLDLGLPDLDGLQVCSQLRERADRHIPILMLTARDAIEDRLRGFTAGADDYLVKPFSGEELVARCRALSYRHRVGQSHTLCIGGLRIDRSTGTVTREGRTLALQQTAYRILLFLAEAWPRPLTRSELVDRLWGDDVPPSDPLRSHLYLLRSELDRPFERPMLQTVHGVGFKLDEHA